MTTLVFIYIIIGLGSAAVHYLVHPDDFTNENLRKAFSTETFHETRVVLFILKDVMTWPLTLFLKLREKNK